MKHQNISITTDNGTDVLAQAPIIISARSEERRVGKECGS